MERKNVVYILICIITSLPWLGYLYFFYDSKIIVDNNSWSQFGSFIGGVSASLTLPLTLTFVYRTYLSQKVVEKLNLDSVALQKFNNYFFELLKTFNKYRFEQMTFWRESGGKKELFSGSRFFIENRRRIQRKEKEGSTFSDAFNIVIDFNNLSFEYYFRTLNTLFEWIENHDINESQKKKYNDLIISSLTNDERYFVKNINELKYNWSLNLLKSKSSEITLSFEYKK